MKRKLLSIFLVLALVISFMPALSPDDAYAEEGIRHDVVDGILIVSGSGEVKDVPSEYKSCIAVKINDGITSIGEEAFSEWSDLEFVELSNTVKEIKAGAFRSCKELRVFTFQPSLKTVDSTAMVDAGVTKTVGSKVTSVMHVRTYKTVSGKKYYSSWSAAKSVKIKK